MAWLGEELPEKEQDGRTPFAPRCVKDVVEERLFAHRRDLLTRLDLVFMDTTSLYFEGAGGTDPWPARLQQRPSSGPAADDPRSADRRRRAAGLLGDVAGDTADVTTLIPVIIGCGAASTSRGCAWSPTAA